MQGSKYKRSTGTSTRIYNKFEHWSMEDCACVHCINYDSKEKSCTIPACAIADIKQEAVRREEAVKQTQ